MDVNSKVQDVTQIPPLHLAAVSGTEMLVRSLILAGARVNDTDAHRNTALHAAAKAGQAAVVSALLQVTQAKFTNFGLQKMYKWLPVKLIQIKFSLDS